MWWTWLLFLVPSLVLLTMNWLSPAPFVLLYDSRGTRLGVFVSLFVHSDVKTDFLPNITYLLVYSAVFVAANQSCNVRERYTRSKAYAISVVVASVLANLIWTAESPVSAYGSSGAAFGALGAIMAFSLYNALSATKRRADVNPQAGDGLLVAVPNAVIFLNGFLLLLLDPDLLLGAPELVNVAEHGIALLVAFLICLTFVLARRVQRGPEHL